MMDRYTIIRNWACLIGALIVLGAIATNLVPKLAPEPETPITTPYVAYVYYKPT